MFEIFKPISASRRSINYGAIIAIFWTATLLSICFVDLIMDRKDMINEARINATTALDKDMVYRQWNTMHGGVYVPLTEKNPSNPFLDVPDKNIITQDGKVLTLVNPAYMTRQVHELGKESYGTRGHITSLNPLRPQNASDAWEIEALNLFNQGVQEIYSEEIVGGKPYLRLIRPILTEKQCLKCHEKQGYQEGDIRGGVGVSVFLEPYFTIHSKHTRFSIWMYALIWMAGIVSLFSEHLIWEHEV